MLYLMGVRLVGCPAMRPPPGSLFSPALGTRMGFQGLKESPGLHVPPFFTFILAILPHSTGSLRRLSDQLRY